MAHILIVEDEERLRDLMAQIVEGMGHTCDQAGNGVEGCRRVGEREYDLILTDVRMPEMDGITFLERIEEAVQSTTPCIIITALAHEPRVAVRAVRLAYDFLAKPFEMEEMVEAVERGIELRMAWLARRRHQEDLEAAVAAKTRELGEAYEGALLALAVMLENKDLHQDGEDDQRKRDIGTRIHCDRVRTLCREFARDLGLPESEVRKLELGAVLHDVGKARIPDRVLQKTGPFNEEDWREIRRHPLYGAEIVQQIPFFRDALEVVLHHHERWDGTGYPLGLAGESVPSVARVFALVDAYDAMTSERCYRKRRSPQEASSEILRHAGTQFDPLLARRFCALVPRLVPAGPPAGPNGRAAAEPVASCRASGEEVPAARTEATAG